jgi:N-dimethylarginine dimethylaminohydrolase
MNSIEINVNSDYGKLKSVIVNDASTIVSFGKKLSLIENKYEAFYSEKESKYHPEDGLWDINKLKKQVRNFQKILQCKGVQLIYSANIKDAYLQLFTRDIGFSVGDTFYIGKMRHKIRSLEQKGIDTIKSSFSKVIELNIPYIEGGDIFVHHDKVFIGLSRQTTYDAFEELRPYLEQQGFKCYSIVCDESVLHLDCRFNIINKDTAFLSEAGISKEGVNIIKEHFKTIQITDDEIISLASNYFIINSKEAVVDTRNKRIAKILKKYGYNVTEIECTELTKLWGSLRCATCPLYRE